MRSIRQHFPVLFYITILLAAIGLVLCFQLLVTDGTSMEPTFRSGDLLLKIFPYKEPQVGDIVAIRHQDKLMVKRVAAVAGQSAIAPDENFLREEIIGPASVHYENLPVDDYLRGMDLWGNHIYWNQYNYWSTDGSATVPEGYIFVVGDNLLTSYDSRTENFGLVPVEEITGYVLFRIMEGEHD